MIPNSGTETSAPEGKKAGRQQTRRKRSTQGTAKPARVAPKKQRGRGKRYTPAEKAKILVAAKKRGLTGAQVAKEFGIASLTFYRWRGPVRGKRRATPGVGRPKGSGRVTVDASAVRREVQAQIRKMLPQIIKEEVAAALGR